VDFGATEPVTAESKEASFGEASFGEASFGAMGLEAEQDRASDAQDREVLDFETAAPEVLGDDALVDLGLDSAGLGDLGEGATEDGAIDGPALDEAILDDEGSSRSGLNTDSPLGDFDVDLELDEESLDLGAVSLAPTEIPETPLEALGELEVEADAIDSSAIDSKLTHAVPAAPPIENPFPADDPISDLIRATQEAVPTGSIPDVADRYSLETVEFDSDLQDLIVNPVQKQVQDFGGQGAVPAPEVSNPRAYIQAQLAQQQAAIAAANPVDPQTLEDSLTWVTRALDRPVEAPAPQDLEDRIDREEAVAASAHHVFLESATPLEIVDRALNQTLAGASVGFGLASGAEQTDDDLLDFADTDFPEADNSGFSDFSDTSSDWDGRELEESLNGELSETETPSAVEPALGEAMDDPLGTIANPLGEFELPEDFDPLSDLEFPSPELSALDLGAESSPDSDSESETELAPDLGDLDDLGSLPDLSHATEEASIDVPDLAEESLPEQVPGLELTEDMGSATDLDLEASLGRDLADNLLEQDELGDGVDASGDTSEDWGLEVPDQSDPSSGEALAIGEADMPPPSTAVTVDLAPKDAVDLGHDEGIEPEAGLAQALSEGFGNVLEDSALEDSALENTALEDSALEANSLAESTLDEDLLVDSDLGEELLAEATVGKDLLEESALAETVPTEEALGEDLLGENPLAENGLEEDVLGADLLAEADLGDGALDAEDALGVDLLGDSTLDAEDALGVDLLEDGALEENALEEDALDADLRGDRTLGEEDVLDVELLEDSDLGQDLLEESLFEESAERSLLDNELDDAVLDEALPESSSVEENALEESALGESSEDKAEEDAWGENLLADGDLEDSDLEDSSLGAIDLDETALGDDLLGDSAVEDDALDDALDDA
ncbi:MAG: hypothetical protein ACO4CG_13545, partial [Prochlorothrix sp.]